MAEHKMHGITWSPDDNRDDLYQAARALELPVRSRMTKPEIVKELKKEQRKFDRAAAKKAEEKQAQKATKKVVAKKATKKTGPPPPATPKETAAQPKPQAPPQHQAKARRPRVQGFPFGSKTQQKPRSKGSRGARLRSKVTGRRK